MSRALAVIALVALAGCRGSAPSSSGAPAPARSAEAAPPRIVTALAVPRTRGPIALDGELEEDSWRDAVRTGPFLDAKGGEARPFSDARFLRDDERLYVVLYAADDDIRATVKKHDDPVWTDDAFSVELSAGGSALLLDVSALGTVTDARREGGGRLDVSWESGMKLGVDRDGTLGDPSDEDEEWVIEGALPLAALGLRGAAQGPVGLTISRCDTPRAGGPRRCGRFEGALDLGR